MMNVAQALWFDRRELSFFPIGTTFSMCPTCEKYAPLLDGIPLQIWDTFLGFHMRDHLSEQATTFLKDQ